eukprot:CFRG0191T1
MVISEDLFSKFNLNELLLDIDVNDSAGLLNSTNWLDDAFYADDASCVKTGATILSSSEVEENTNSITRTASQSPSFRETETRRSESEEGTFSPGEMMDTKSLNGQNINNTGGPIRSRGRRRANRITVAAVRQAMQLSELQQQNSHGSTGAGLTAEEECAKLSQNLDLSSFEESVVNVKEPMITSGIIDTAYRHDSVVSNDTVNTFLASPSSFETMDMNRELSESQSMGGPKPLKQGEMQAAHIMGSQLSKSDLEKLEAKLEKNRKMAKESRQKKKEYVKGIEQRCRQYELVIQKLNERLAATSRCNGALITELVAANNGVLPPNVASILNINHHAYSSNIMGYPAAQLIPQAGSLPIGNMSNSSDGLAQQTLVQVRPNVQPGLDFSLGNPGNNLVAIPGQFSHMNFLQQPRANTDQKMYMSASSEGDTCDNSGNTTESESRSNYAFAPKDEPANSSATKVMNTDVPCAV